MSLKINPKYLEEILANLPGHVYWKDKNGVFLGCNLQQAKDAGFDSISEMIGKTDYEMPWQGQASYLQEIDQRVISSGRTITTEEVSEIYGGTKQVYLSSKLPLFDDNQNIVGVLGISLDITERKKLEQELIKAKKLAEAANQAKTEFLENMRHDIRTPLTGIVGFAKIIKDEATTPRVKEYADNLIESSHALLDFLNEILEGIKVFSLEMPIARTKFSMKDLAKKVINLFTPRIREKNLKLSTNIDTNIPAFVIGDPMRIQRIIIELLSNAINFTTEGRIELDIELIRQNEKELVIQIRVKDTGIGIPEDKRDEIFLRFKRLIPSYKGLYKGAGLGLAIVKQFVDDLKGEIYCQGADSIGTVFTCLIPVQEPLLETDVGAIDVESIVSFDKIHPPYQKTVSTSKEPDDKTEILIVEDQTIAAKVAESIIKKLNCSVDVAADGKSAMTLFCEKPYALIFMDVGLPDISGLDLTKQIRLKERELGGHIPIVALTAHMDTENKQECIFSGMDAVISKPLMQSTAEDILNAFIPSRGKKEEHDSVDNKETLLILSGEVLSLQEGVEKLGGNVEAAKEMIRLLKEHIEEELPKLISAVSTEDWVTIKAIIHKLRGGCAYCGAQRLKEACAKLENYLYANKTQYRPELFQQLIEEMKKVLEIKT